VCVCFGTVGILNQFGSLDRSESMFEVVDPVWRFLAIHCSCMCSRVERPTVATAVGYWQCVLCQVERSKLPEKDLIFQCSNLSKFNSKCIKLMYSCI
jgi:hypothetical protein